MSSMDSTTRNILVTLLAAGVGVAQADLRMACQPQNNYAVRQRNQVKFVATANCSYMEPSVFNYQGLRNQRDGGAYDNFLRSNIDNEQDKRNFNTEAGKDMLPFRSYEGAETTASGTVKTKLPDSKAITVNLNEQTIIPLRWNNPHASELEVNIWVSDDKYVVPIRKPTCSGEGHQDNVFAFTVPADFNTVLAATIPNFAGCNVVGDCVLQVYAHSVESRTYAMGTPLIVKGTVPANTAGAVAKVQPAGVDVGTNLAALTRDLCLSSNDASADITTTVPRAARLVSDVYNHAYQNSDYSPYSGQQPEAISRNLQASCIISMVTGNRGELGRALLTNDQKNYIGNLETKAKNLIKKYEGITNNIINTVLKDTKTTGPTADGVQPLVSAFRSAEVGAVTATRLETNTYVPSFQIPADKVAAAKAKVPAQYAQLIDGAGQLKIYQAALNDLSGEFAKAAARGFKYQTAQLKTTATTLADATNYIKKDANGKADGGKYAATQAAKISTSAAFTAKYEFEAATSSSTIADILAADGELPGIGDATEVASTPDMDALNGDSPNCDNDAIMTDETTVCVPPQQMFKPSGLEDDISPNSATSNVVNTIALAALSALSALFFA